METSNSIFCPRGVSFGDEVDRAFLTVFKMLTKYEYFFGNFIFALIALKFSGNRLKNNIES